MIYKAGEKVRCIKKEERPHYPEDESVDVGAICTLDREWDSEEDLWISIREDQNRLCRPECFEPYNEFLENVREACNENYE